MSIIACAFLGAIAFLIVLMIIFIVNICTVEEEEKEEMKGEDFANLVWNASIKAAEEFIDPCKNDQTYWILHRNNLCEIIQRLCDDQICNAIKEGKKNPKFFDEYLELIDLIKKSEKS